MPTSLSNSSVEAWQSYYRGSQFSEFLGSGEASFIRLREPDALYDLTVDLNELNGAISAFKDDYVSLKFETLFKVTSYLDDPQQEVISIN